MKIYESIDFQKIDKWYIIYDTSKCRTYDFIFASDIQTQKILELTCDKKGFAGHPQINMALDLIKDGFVYIMDDDNIFHKTFWTLLPTLDPECVYTWDQNRIQETPKRILKGGQIEVNQIDTSQFIVPRALIGSIRWAVHKAAGDFRFIIQVYRKHKDAFRYIPKVACYHNFITKSKVAVCFFGLTRSLKFTMPSIEKYLLGPLKNHGVKYSVFLHTYKLKTPYTNPRAGESEILLDVNEYKLLDPDFKMIEDKDMVSKRLDLAAYRTKGDPWGKEKEAIPGDFTTLDNHILYLWSQKQLTGMVESAQSKYTHIIFCRPDVLYQVQFQLDWLRFDSEKIFIPNFGLCANMNDRFAVGQTKQMVKYGSRFDEALAYSKKEPLASEAFLIATMKRHKLDYEHVNFYFTRIRANGEKNGMDLGQIRKLTRRKRKKGTRKHFKGHIQISNQSGGNSKIVVFELTNNAGFFSVFWFMCKAYIYAKENKYPFFIDNTSWQYTYKKGWHDYFKTLNVFIKEEHSGKTILRFAHSNIHTIQSDYSIQQYITAVKEIYILHDNLQNTIHNFIKQNGPYKSLYIRRGDKKKEVTLLSTKDILNQTSIKNDGGKVFIQTDDYTAVEEVKQILPNCSILTICSSSSRGSNNKNISSMSPEERKKETENFLISIGLFLGGTEGWTYYLSNVGTFHKLAEYQKVKLYIDKLYTKEQIEKAYNLDSIGPPYDLFYRHGYKKL